MNAQRSQLDDLEEILASKDISRRAEILRRITDLFVVGSGNFSEAQVELFDDVMGKLLENVERSARAQFGNRLATLSDAPPNTIRALASDDSIEVAGPVLLHSEGLDDDALIETAERGAVDYLVSEDEDLHAPEVKDYLSAAGIRVLKVREFLDELRRGGAE